jgi:two-component system LytT family sensor kinase
LRRSTRARRFWTLQLAGWAGYGLAMFAALIPSSPSLRQAWLQTAMFVAVGFVISLMLRAFYHRLLQRDLSFPAITFAAIACSYGAGIVWAVCYNYTHGQIMGAPVTEKPLLEYFQQGLDFTFVFVAWSALYIGTGHYHELQMQRERSLQATALATQAQLQMLRYQLNPHFLFNALNSIRALVREDQAKAEQMVAELSDFLRYSLQRHEGRDVPLGAELEAVEHYLTLEHIRFEDKLVAEIDADQAARSRHVPGFLLHPLVENAITYGMETSPLPLRVRVFARCTDVALHLEVANTGRWRPPAETAYPSSRGHGIGLHNVRERLHHAFPGRHRVEVAERDGWVRVTIEMWGGARQEPATIGERA